MLKGQCQKFLINRKCQKRLMFLQSAITKQINSAIHKALHFSGESRISHGGAPRPQEGVPTFYLAISLQINSRK